MISNPLPMRDALLDRIWQSMGEDKKIFFLSADFGSPILDKIRRDFPERFINVGIAEQNLINISAGLALEGYTVFAYAIAPFLTMRCYEQIRVSLALMSEVRDINVNLIGVGAGYSYVVSGPTHQCYEDITLMRALPNFQVLSPADHVTAEALFEVCIKNSGPKYLRLDAQVLPSIYHSIKPDIVAGFNVLNKGQEICMLSTGYMTHTALKVVHALKENKVNVGLIDLFNISHFSPDAILKEINGYSKLVTMEEGFRGRGGVDSMMFSFLSMHYPTIRILNLGVEGMYRFELGSREELHEKAGIGPKFALRAIENFIGHNF